MINKGPAPVDAQLQQKHSTSTGPSQSRVLHQKGPSTGRGPWSTKSHHQQGPSTCWVQQLKGPAQAIKGAISARAQHQQKTSSNKSSAQDCSLAAAASAQSTHQQGLNTSRTPVSWKCSGPALKLHNGNVSPPPFSLQNFTLKFNFWKLRILSTLNNSYIWLVNKQ